LTSLWTMSAWTLLPVMLLSSPLVAITRRDAVRILALAVLLPLVMVALAPAIAFGIHRAGPAPDAALSSVLVEPIEQLWRATTDRPLKVFAGYDDFTDGVAFYMHSHPLAAHVARSRPRWSSASAVTVSRCSARHARVIRRARSVAYPRPRLRHVSPWASSRRSRSPGATSGSTERRPAICSSPFRPGSRNTFAPRHLSRENAALRDFGPVCVRFGSNSTALANATRPSMSAIPPIATINSLR
jgi:hypothetical protein